MGEHGIHVPHQHQLTVSPADGGGDGGTALGPLMEFHFHAKGLQVVCNQVGQLGHVGSVGGTAGLVHVFFQGFQGMS